MLCSDARVVHPVHTEITGYPVLQHVDCDIVFKEYLALWSSILAFLFHDLENTTGRISTTGNTSLNESLV